MRILMIDVQAGGSPTYTLTEDYALGMEMLKRQWQCRYVPSYLVVGEAPEQVRNAMQQRSRWVKVRPSCTLCTPPPGLSCSRQSSTKVLPVDCRLRARPHERTAHPWLGYSPITFASTWNVQGHFQIMFSWQHCPLFQWKLPVFMRIMYCSGVWNYITGAISTPLFIVVPMITIWCEPTPQHLVHAAFLAHFEKSAYQYSCCFPLPCPCR